MELCISASSCLANRRWECGGNRGYGVVVDAQGRPTKLMSFSETPGAETSGTAICNVMQERCSHFQGSQLGSEAFALLCGRYCGVGLLSRTEVARKDQRPP